MSALARLNIAMCAACLIGWSALLIIPSLMADHCAPSPEPLIGALPFAASASAKESAQ